MATTRKPAAKKPAAKKSTAKRTTAKKPAQPKKDPLEGLSQEQIQSAVRAGNELANAGLPIPAKVKQITEAWVERVEANAPKPVEERLENDLALTSGAPVRNPVPRPEVPRRDEVAASSAEPQYQTQFIRTIYNSELHLRWEDDAGKKRKIELKARGQRGDIHPISEKDAKDPNFQQLLQKNLHVLEVITTQQAQEIVSHQTTNQQAFHPAMAALRGESGQPIAPENVHLTASFEDQGVTVAHLEPVVEGELGNIPGRGRAGIDWQTARSGQRQQPQRQLGGNPAILSDGFAAQQTSQFIPTPDNAAAAAADQVARQRGAEGPGAAGISRVTVAPVQKA